MTKFDLTAGDLAKSWAAGHIYPGMTMDEFRHASEMYQALRVRGWTAVQFPTAEGPKVRWCDTKVQFECAQTSIYRVIEAAYNHVFGKGKSN